MRLPRFRTLLLSSAAWLATGVAGFAQEPQPQQTEPPAPAAIQVPPLEVAGRPAANAGYQPRQTTLGAGTETPILEIPQSVAVVPRAVLRDQDARSLDEALGNVSGIAQANNLGGTQDAFLRRGFGDNRDGSIMIDGLRTVIPRSLTSMTDYVEVLKGPSSALYGILDPGGLVNVVPLRPELVQQGALTGRLSSFGGGSTGIDVTGPLGGGFAYRVTGDIRNQEYWRSFGSIKRRQINPSLAWYGQDTMVVASYWHEDYAVPFDRGTIFDPRTGKAVPVSARQRMDERYNVSRGYSDYASVRINHRLNADWTISAGYAYSLSNYADQQARVVAYNASTGQVTRRADATDDSTMFSHAVRADLAGRVALLGMRHDLVLGTSYDYASTRRSELVRGANNTRFNIFNPVYGQLAAPGHLGNDADSDQTERLQTFALYAQDSVHLTDRLIFVGGLRWQQFDQIAGKGRRPFTLNTDVNAGRLVPRASLVYLLTPDISVYGTYSQSFKPNSSIANAYGSQPPETGESWEIGAKFDLLEGLTATVSAFDIVKQNVLYRYEVNGDPVNATAGEVRSRGIELDLAGRITPRLSAIGSYALVDAKVTEDPETKNKRLLNVARDTASLFFTYDFGEVLGSDGLRAGFGGRYMGRRPGDADNSFYLPGYAVFDAFAAYDTHIQNTPLRLQVNVKNILDKTYYTSSIGTNLGVAVGEPMQVTASATVRF